MHHPKRGNLAMTREAIFRYADEIVDATLRGDDGARHALDHLRGLLIVSAPVYCGLDSPRKCMLYFLANYTQWARRRDSTDAECDAMQDLTHEDALALVDHLLAMPYAAEAMAQRRALMW